MCIRDRENSNPWKKLRHSESIDSGFLQYCSYSPSIAAGSPLLKNELIAQKDEVRLVSWRKVYLELILYQASTGNGIKISRLAVQILIRIPKSILFSSQNLFIRPLHRISCRFNISWKEKPTPKRHKSFYFPILILHGERHFFVSQWESSEIFFVKSWEKLPIRNQVQGRPYPREGVLICSRRK